MTSLQWYSNFLNCVYDVVDESNDDVLYDVSDNVIQDVIFVLYLTSLYNVDFRQFIWWRNIELLVNDDVIFFPIILFINIRVIRCPYLKGFFDWNVCFHSNEVFFWFILYFAWLQIIIHLFTWIICNVGKCLT